MKSNNNNNNNDKKHDINIEYCIVVYSQLISLSKDGKAIMWDISSGKKIHELTWEPPQGCKYMYKRCRFGVVEEDKDKSRLFILTNPVGHLGKLKAYLQLWDAESGNLVKLTSFTENVSSLAVRDDGRFVAVGTMFSGSVEIFIAFSLQVRLKTFF